jgi:protein-L-isoaspartate O-methyltransferase
MIVPVGGLEEQTLKMVVKRGRQTQTTDVAPVRFVPLLGTHGWEQQP